MAELFLTRFPFFADSGFYNGLFSSAGAVFSPSRHQNACSWHTNAAGSIKMHVLQSKCMPWVSKFMPRAIKSWRGHFSVWHRQQSVWPRQHSVGPRWHSEWHRQQLFCLAGVVLWSFWPMFMVRTASCEAWTAFRVAQKVFCVAQTAFCVAQTALCVPRRHFV